MKNIICSRNGATAGFQVSNVSNEEFYLVGDLRILGLVLVTHVVLLFLVAGEDADFLNICSEEALENSVSEGSSASTNQKDFVFENGHKLLCLLLTQRIYRLKCAYY